MNQARQLDPSRTRPSNSIATNSETVGSLYHSLRHITLLSYYNLIIFSFVLRRCPCTCPNAVRNRRGLRMVMLGRANFETVIRLGGQTRPARQERYIAASSRRFGPVSPRCVGCLECDGGHRRRGRTPKKRPVLLLKGTAAYVYASHRNGAAWRSSRQLTSPPSLDPW
jgi:hypothetical protein